MNILILNQYALPAGASGITRHGDLGASLVKKGHAVTVIASGFDYLTRKVHCTNSVIKPNLENYSGVEFFWLKTTAYTDNGGKRIVSMLEYCFKAAWKGLFLRDQHKPNIIIASSPQLLVGLTGIFLSLYHRVPMIFEMRDVWPSALASLGAISESSLTYRTLELIEKFIYSQAARIIGVPPSSYQRIEELGLSSKNFVHIPNGIAVDTSIFSGELIPQSLSEIIQSESSRKIIMYAGAHGFANKLVEVLDCLEYLRKYNLSSYEGIALVFIGDGQQRKSLIESAKSRGLDHVYFHPRIEKKIIKIALKKSDFLLFYTPDSQHFKYGLSPNKLYDYFEAAKPILFSCAEKNNIIEKVGAGVTFHPGNPESLASAIIEISKLPAKTYQEMGQRGRDYVIKNHDWDKLAHIYETIMYEVVQL